MLAMYQMVNLITLNESDLFKSCWEQTKNINNRQKNVRDSYIQKQKTVSTKKQYDNKKV